MPTNLLTHPALCDRRISELAARHHDVLTTPQLVACGLTQSSIRRRIQRGTLHRVRPGIYTFGSRSLSSAGRLRVAELHGGPGSAITTWAALSGRSIVQFEPKIVEVVTPNRRLTVASPLARVRCVRTETLHRADWDLVDGVRVARPIRAIADLASHIPLERMVRLLRESIHQRAASIGELESFVARNQRHPEHAKLRQLLIRAKGRGAGSRGMTELEIFHRLEFAWVIRARLNHLTGVWYDGKEIEGDVSWPGHPLIVQLDGGDHADPTVHDNDLGQDRALRASGRPVLRIWNDDFSRDPDGATRDVVNELERLAPPGLLEDTTGEW